MNENIVLTTVPLFCDSCGERIFRAGFHINDSILCNRCVKDKFSVNINEKEDNYKNEN